MNKDCKKTVCVMARNKYQHFVKIVKLTYLPMKMEQSVPKRRHIKFRRRGLTQKKGVEFYTYLPMKMEQSVAKRRHIKFRRRGITQKKTYEIMYALAMTKKGEVN
jgi:hypothetical protein